MPLQTRKFQGIRHFPITTYKTTILKTLQRLEGEENEGALQFQAAIQQGLLTVVDFESEEEAESFVNYAAVLGDDGESATCAIAVHRGWAIATDDKAAIALFRRETRYLQVLSTLEIIKHWSEKTSLNSSALRDVRSSEHIISNDALPFW